MNDVVFDVEKARRLIKRYDVKYQSGMDHQEGFDFAEQMVDILGDACNRIEALELEDHRCDAQTQVVQLREERDKLKIEVADLRALAKDSTPR